MRAAEDAFWITPDIRYDPRRMAVLVGTELNELTRFEARVLESLPRRANSIVPHGDLITAVWGETPAISISQLQNLVCRLRRKLGPQGHELIKNRHGIGYILLSAFEAAAGRAPNPG